MKIKDIEQMAESHVAKKTGVQFIDTRVEEMRNPQGSVADYYSFFFELTKKYKPEVVVELGAWQGTSAACFAAGNPDGTVITVDHHTDPGDQENKQKTLQAQERFKNLTYCQGWTCDQLYEEEKDKHSIKGENAFTKVKKALNGRKIDVLFIDSWHEYTQAVKDWEAYKPLLNSPCLVICDDILQGNPGDGIDNMVKFWEELKGEKYLNHSLHKGFPQGYLLWS
jgi:predicted O-methyltransferase YrrM